MIPATAPQATEAVVPANQVPTGAEGCIVLYPICFDVSAYRSLNLDLPTTWTVEELWVQFSEHGHAETSRFEYYCPGVPLLAQSQGICLRVNSTCFDFAFYLRHSADLGQPGASREEDLWTHFVQHGQHEGRKFRFKCRAQAEQGLPPRDETLVRGGGSVVRLVKSCWPTSHPDVPIPLCDSSCGPTSTSCPRTRC